MIPTIGRQVWFRDKHSTTVAQPEAATVCFVQNDNLVNLRVIGHDGNARAELNVPLIEDGDNKARPQYNSLPISYCTWMPYQKAVAAGQIPPAMHAQPMPVRGTAESDESFSARMLAWNRRDETYKLDSRGAVIVPPNGLTATAAREQRERERAAAQGYPHPTSEPSAAAMHDTLESNAHPRSPV